MTKRDIEKAATDIGVIEKGIMNPELEPYYREGFSDGAKWRINSVWHYKDEEPNREEDLVLINHQGIWGYASMWFIKNNYKDWISYARSELIARWAYKKDLLPNTED